MASLEHEISLASRSADHEHDEDEAEEDEENSWDDDDDDDSNKMSFFLCGTKRGGGSSCLGGVLDPRASWVQEWNRVFLLVCAAGLFVDPLFFYALSISDSYLCLFVDGWFAITVTVLRCMTDALHVWNMWLQLKMSKHPYSSAGIAGRKETSSRAVAIRYLKGRKRFLLDLFVILPVPQSGVVLSLQTNTAGRRHHTIHTQPLP